MTAWEILPGLWQSGWPDDPGWLTRTGIRTAVNLVPPDMARIAFGRDWPPYPDGLAVVRCPFYDWPDTTPTTAWLDEVSLRTTEALAGGPTLVHCAFGNNRSTIAVAAALVRLLGCSADDALARVWAVHLTTPLPTWIAGLRAWSPREVHR